MQNSLWILLLSTASVAFFHSLAPDHWMPFAAIGRAQKWTKSRLLWVTFLAGLGHVGISVLVGMIGIVLGFSLARLEGIEGHRGAIVLWLLIGFGIAYMIWGIKKGREHSHSHSHIDGEKLKSKKVAVWTLFAIFILGPCEPLVPLVFLGYNYGYAGIIAVSLIFSIITIVMMLAQSLLAFMGVQLIKHDFAERYSHAFAGLVITLTGISVMVLGI
ncbi:hypothetical protein ACFL2J_06595 [Candidatus Omnitrophota bacterium]